MNILDRTLKMILFTKKNKNLEKDNEIKKVLFLTLQFGLGDAVRTTNFIEALAEKYDLDTLGNGNQKTINRYNPKIATVFQYACKKNRKVKKSIMSNLKLIWKLKNNKYDLVIDGSSSGSAFNLIFLRLIKPKKIYGYRSVNNKYNFKNISLYDKLFNNTSDLMEFLKLNNCNRQIYLPLDRINQELKNKKFEIVFNTEGSNKFISNYKLIEILKLIEKNLNKKIVLVSVSRRKEIQKLLDTNKFNNIELLPLVSFYEIMYIIKKSDILISPDTSLIHVASVYNKKILGLYPNKEGFIEVWGPESSRYEVITPKEKTDNFDYLDKINSRDLLESLKKLI